MGDMMIQSLEAARSDDGTDQNLDRRDQDVPRSV
jgi:hypothetical protein